MSDQTQDKLWTDDAIYAWADKLSKYTVLHQCRVIETVHSGDVEALAEQIRDDYEQRLAAVVAERDQLRQELAALEQAGAWEPVPDAKWIPAHGKGEDYCGVYQEGNNLLFDIYNNIRGVVLPDDIRLCRRTGGNQ